MYVYADRPTRPMTDGGRIVYGEQRFRASVTPGRDATLVMRTDAWYASRLRVTVDGKPAGLWTIARSETAWVEPRFTLPGALVSRPRPEIRLEREKTGDGGNIAPFHIWIYQ